MMLDAPIYLRLSPSRRLRDAVIVAHCSLLLLLACYGPHHVASVVITAAVAFSLAVYLVKPWRCPAEAIETLLLRSDEGWEVKTRDCPPVSAELLSDAFVSPWMTVLRFRLADGRCRTAFVLSDNVPADPFRRLRVRLRLAARRSVADPDPPGGP
jgi:hypothetical protein